MTDLSQGTLNPVPGTPILTITPVPQQVPIGTGATLINESTMNIILSTDSIPNPSNSFNLRPNGASLPITVGPLWASVVSGTASLVVIPQVLNVFNPNVLATSPGGATKIDISVPTLSQAQIIAAPPAGNVIRLQAWNAVPFGGSAPPSSSATVSLTDHNGINYGIIIPYFDPSQDLNGTVSSQSLVVENQTSVTIFACVHYDLIGVGH